MQAVRGVPVLVFSDYTCPFCYVMEALLRARAAEGRIALTHRALELHPAPAPLPPPEPWPAALVELGREAGLDPGGPAARPRTAKAHELAYLAREAGVGDAVHAAIFAAYWAEGRDIGRIDVLVDLAAAHGIDAGLARATLDVDRFTAHVARDRAAAEALGIPGAPAMIFGTGEGALLLLGAQPPADIDTAIHDVSENL
jgi:predicted DsbA family dithiol-disulfide isomerase